MNMYCSHSVSSETIFPTCESEFLFDSSDFIVRKIVSVILTGSITNFDMISKGEAKFFRYFLNVGKL